MAYDKTKMQDIKYSEKELWAQYVSYWQSGNLSGIATLLNNNPQLKYKIFNAYNWNRLINSVNDTTETTSATTDSLVGIWENDYKSLLAHTDPFKYVGLWASGKSYKKNNLVKVDNFHSYYCKQNHTSSSSNMPPNDTYWLRAEGVLGHVGIDVLATAPSDMVSGDIYFEEIG